MTRATSTTSYGSIELKNVGDLQGRFVIPSYQRGYRWQETEVRQLLDDLWSNGDKLYCLQPVVVIPTNDEWELVDGQQRLSTLLLVFLYMKRAGFKRSDPPYRLRFASRPRSDEFFQALGRGEPPPSGDNIDFFHLHKALAVIENWFKSHGSREEFVAGKLYGYLYERAKVIWFEAPADVDANELFARLNVGRIPLTDAELLKATLLAPTAERAIATPERIAEVAAQWDDIERELHDEELWAFVTNDPAEKWPTRIGLLFELLIDEKTTGGSRFKTFDALRERVERDRRAFWSEVLARFATLREWYEDRELFHKVGYLIAEGESLKALIDDASQKTRSAFRASLDERIGELLKLTPDELRALEYKDAEKLARALRLMNVVTVMSLRDSTERYPFRLDKKQRWSLEHIHAQHAEGFTKKAQWQAWLRDHREALDARDEAQRALRGEIDAVIDTVDKNTFEALAPRVIACFTASEGEHEEHTPHAISNLALLSSEANSALNNSVFEVKRRRVLEMDRAGAYIPICTRRVFLKYFTKADAQQVHLWSRQDRGAYLDEIVATLAPYLSEEATP